MANKTEEQKVQKVETVKKEEPKLETPIEEVLIDEVEQIEQPTEEQLFREQVNLRLANEEKQRKIEAGHLVEEEGDTDEIIFLKKIYDIQNDGCYGKHLNELIKNRIAEIKAK